MNNPVLRRGSKLRDVVARLQLTLQGLGFTIDIDGAFGPVTEQAVKALQEKQGLDVDGVVGADTWRVLDELSQPDDENPLDSKELLAAFRGDLAWIHGWHTHAGGPYWPGGALGITLDPGIDLGHSSLETITEAYREHLDDDAWQAVVDAIGLRGEAAQERLRHTPILRQLEIDRATAGRIFPHAADPVWRALLQRFPSLGRDGTPPKVQTALLSLAIDHGANANSLQPLRRWIAERNWAELAKAVRELDATHRMERTQKRRRAEAKLIRRAAE